MVSGVRFEKVNQTLASKTLALLLFGVLCLVSVPGTFGESRQFYSSPAFVAVLGALGLNLLLCTIRRIKALSKPVIVIHIGVLVTLAGASVGALGYVATVNVYEGASVDKAYRWDRQEDFSLPVSMTVKKIGMEYYPTPVKVGVFKNREREALFELKTGESFPLGPYEVIADSLDVPSRNLHLSVYNRRHPVGFAETSGLHDLPAGFPYSFVLVAYKNPAPRRVWVALSLSRGGEVVAEGITEANNPFEWGGLNFHNTELAYDPYGNRYAGIQITRDPGRHVVYCGFAVLCLGAAMYMIRRVHEGR